MLSPIFFEVTGFIGVAFYLGSYAALQAGLVKGSGYAYATLNLLAASFVLMSLFGMWNLWSAIIQISWIVLSLGGMLRVWLIRKTLRFTPEEEQFLSSKFPGLDPILARKLLNCGAWHDAQPGETMTREGVPVTQVCYLFDGAVAVDVGGQQVAHVGADQFIGEIACLGKGPASATVTVTAPTRCFSLQSDDLIKLMAKNADIAPHVHFAFSGNTQSKLIALNQAHSDALRSRPA